MGLLVILRKYRRNIHFAVQKKLNIFAHSFAYNSQMGSQLHLLVKIYYQSIGEELDRTMFERIWRRGELLARGSCYIWGKNRRPGGLHSSQGQE